MALWVDPMGEVGNGEKVLRSVGLELPRQSDSEQRDEHHAYV